MNRYFRVCKSTFLLLASIGLIGCLSSGCQLHEAVSEPLSLSELAAIGDRKTTLASDPTIWESGWSVSQRIPLTAAHSAHFNPVDQRVYIGRRVGLSGGGGVYRVVGGNTVLKVVAGSSVAGVMIANDGTVFFSEDYSGTIFRYSAQDGKQLWVSGFRSGNGDPVGMTIAPSNYTGTVLTAGQALVVDRGSNGFDDVWRFSTTTAQGEVLAHSDNGTLVDPVDVAINSTTVLIADRKASGGGDGLLYIMDANGGLTQRSTSIAFRRPDGIAVDPRTDEFVVADSALNAVYRLHPSGSVSKILDGIDVYGWAGIDFNADGSQLVVTARDEVFILSNCDAALFPGQDCNGNGITDICDIDAGASDCDGDRIPDACELAADPGLDCDSDGTLDECLACNDMDIAFVMDTSASMEDEGGYLCSQLDGLVSQFAAAGVNLNAVLLGINSTGSSVFRCLEGTVVASYGTTVPGNPPANNETLAMCPGGTQLGAEDWGRAVSVTAANHPWTSGAVRVVVPLSDEGPWCGDPVADPGVDRDSVEHAIAIASEHNVIVSPVTGNGSNADVIALATDLATGTGGSVHSSADAATSLFDALTDAINSACQQAYDCDADGQPDSCQLDAGTATDCDGNGRLDSCDIADGHDPGTC